MKAKAVVIGDRVRIPLGRERHDGSEFTTEGKVVNRRVTEETVYLTLAGSIGRMWLELDPDLEVEILSMSDT